MNEIIPLAIAGDGPHSRALAAHAAPLGRFSIRSDWHDKEVRAVLVLTAPPERTELVIAALRAGRVVLCSPPAALDAVALERIAAAREEGGGKLIIGGEVAYTEAGARAIEAILAPEFGVLRSLYVAIRQPRVRSGGDVLHDLGWEALDFVLSVTQTRLRRVHATAAALFGGAAQDTIVILMRSADDVVITMELSRCLPDTLPAAGLGEVEVEAIGARQSVRLEPHATSIRICRDSGVSVAPWLDAPVLRMLRAVAAAADGALPDDPLPRQRDALAAMTAIRASIGAAEAVAVEQYHSGKNRDPVVRS
jgi:predicted dehydrogenase